MSKKWNGHIFSQVTPGGYKFGEAVSALQKCIRRGWTVEAVHFATEIDACGSRERQYLWERLQIIISEDIGPTPEGNNLVLLVAQLEKNNKVHIERKGRPQGMFLAHAVIAMCDAPKTRICCHMAHLADRVHLNIPIPDVALDMHTKAGRQMGRGDKHFWEEGQKVENPSDRFKELEDRVIPIVLDTWDNDMKYQNGTGSPAKKAGGDAQKPLNL